LPARSATNKHFVNLFEAPTLCELAGRVELARREETLIAQRGQIRRHDGASRSQILEQFEWRRVSLAFPLKLAQQFLQRRELQQRRQHCADSLHNRYCRSGGDDYHAEGFRQCAIRR
jgi:hypothetical protein